MRELVCNWVEKRLSSYLDGELNRLARAFVRRHLSVCASCRDELTGLQILRLRVQSALHLKNLHPYLFLHRVKGDIASIQFSKPPTHKAYNEWRPVVSLILSLPCLAFVFAPSSPTVLIVAALGLTGATLVDVALQYQN